MARLPRLYAPGVAQHLIQRGNHGEAIFLDDEDYGAWLVHMREAAREHRLAIHAYVLMPNHFHLLATPTNETTLARAMQSLGRRYVAHFNRRHARSGTLWEGRYRSTLVEAGAVLLRCSQYIESNPERNALVADLVHYGWSSYAHHIGLAQDLLVTDHASYWALGNTPFERQGRYRAQFEQALSAADLLAIRDATHKGWALGGAEFTAAMEIGANRRARPLVRGRPKKIHNSPFNQG